MAKSKAWQQLERDTADHFGLKRNIKRGMDWGIVDTDVDVIEADGWRHNYIIDCKYRSNSEGALCELMKEVVDRMPKGCVPFIRYATDEYWYHIMRLEDYTEDFIQEFSVSDGSVVLDDLLIQDNRFVHSEAARKGTKYLDAWFDKLVETYRPNKAAEYKIADDTIIPVIAIRKKGVRQTLIVFRGLKR